MKLPRFLLTAFLAVSVLTLAAHAADVAGEWTWTSVSKSGGAAEITAKLMVKDGVVTGTVTGRQGPAKIGNGTFKDDTVAFTVTRGAPGAESVYKYEGKVSGDTINGSVERPGPVKDGPPIKTTWKATRVP